jgi:hypothetical protein
MRTGPTDILRADIQNKIVDVCRGDWVQLMSRLTGNGDGTAKIVAKHFLADCSVELVIVTHEKDLLNIDMLLRITVHIML